MAKLSVILKTLLIDSTMIEKETRQQMRRFSRQDSHPLVALQSQELVQVQNTIQSLILQCKAVALVAISLHFAAETSQRVRQESAFMICQELRQWVRGSDFVYLYENGSDHSHLLFVLPEADLAGGEVVQQRLQAAFSSVLSQITTSPERIEMRRYASNSENQTTLLTAGALYRDMGVDPMRVAAYVFLSSEHSETGNDQREHTVTGGENKSVHGYEQ